MKWEIRKRLQTGSSISEVCQEYNLSFKDLCDLMLKGTPSSRKNSTGEMYISFLGDRYVIRKRTNRKYTYFGSYKKLDDAVKVRDYLLFKWLVS